MFIAMVVALSPQVAEAHVASTPPTTAPKTTAPKVSTLEKGIVYPRYSPSGYGSSDTMWQGSLQPIKSQTGAQWIEMPVLFEQPTSSSTTVAVGQSTASVASFTAGIRAAHALGYQVFVVPLMAVRAPGGWAGTITFSDQQHAQPWFDSYWQMYQPYIQAAAANQVEQLSIGTELKLMEPGTFSAQWNQLIARTTAIFKNKLTYDMNFSSLDSPLPSWMKNPGLTMIGVSSYFQLADTSQRVDPKNISALWLTRGQKRLDAFSISLGKPVLISEIGYRNSSDALYQPWAGSSSAPADPQEQAGAFDAVLSNVITDSHIGGVFVWGWDDVHALSITGQPAMQTIHKWYTAS